MRYRGTPYSGHPFGEPAVLAAIVLGDELAAAAPALVADAPVADAEGLATAVGRALVGEGGRSCRRVAVLDPLLEFLGRASPDVGGEIRLHAAELAEPHELVGAELIRLGLLAPATESPGAFRGRSDPVAPVILVGEATARPSDDHRPELLHVLDELESDAVDVGHLRTPADPDTVVDDAADVLGELAVDRRPDRGDRLVQQHGDRGLCRGRAPRLVRTRSGNRGPGAPLRPRRCAARPCGGRSVHPSCCWLRDEKDRRVPGDSHRNAITSRLC